MPIVTADVIHRLSGGAANANAALSLGGAKSSSAVPANGPFDDVASDEASAGDIEYRCVYIHNNHGSLTLQNAVAWITNNIAGSRLAIGVGTSAVNGTEQTIANENTAPSGVTFSQPTTKGGGVSLGDIPPGQHRALWLRRTIPSSASASTDTGDYRVEGDTAA